MVHEMTKQLIEKYITTKNVIFIDFYAIWCGPCKVFKPTFEKIAQEFEHAAIFGQLNIDEQKNVAIEYKISSIPTIICIKNGVPCWSHTGTISENALREKIISLVG
jgi:thioredoxin 1